MVRQKQVDPKNQERKQLHSFFKNALGSTPKLDEDLMDAGITKPGAKGNGSRSSGSCASLSTITTPTTTANFRRPNGQAALQEIRRLQRTTHLLIPRAPFLRVVRDVANAELARRRRDQADLGDGCKLESIRFTDRAIQCLHEATEVQITNLFALASLCAFHAKRRTLMVQDLRLTRRIRGREDPLNP